MANIPGSANDRIFAEKVARSPKCARCRNHGFVVQLKGHSGKCQFRECLCWKCSLINERTRILASQRRMKSAHGNESSAADQSEPRAQSGKKPLSVGNNSATNGVNGGNDKKENTRKSAVLREDTGVETYIELQAHHTTCAVNGQPKTPAEPIAPSGAIGDSSPFPGEYIIKETIPGQMYPAEMLAMPLPLYPDRYMIPAVLVSLRPPAPGAFREHVGLVPLPARALPHPLESQEWQIHVPHYSPFPPYEYSHHSQFYMDGQQRGSDIPAASVAEHQVGGNQGTEDVHIESLSPRNVC